MSAFDKVLLKIQNAPVNGHALRNIQHVKNLKAVSEDIKKMLGVFNHGK